MEREPQNRKPKEQIRCRNQSKAGWEHHLKNSKHCSEIEGFILTVSMNIPGYQVEQEVQRT